MFGVVLVSWALLGITFWGSLYDYLLLIITKSRKIQGDEFNIKNYLYSDSKFTYLHIARCRQRFYVEMRVET